MKQDRNGVRTAQDLERKYNLSSMKRAVEQTELGLTKINAELDNFVSATVDTLDNLQDQIDGNITTYYYDGVPTLSNLPASEWSPSEYNVHLGDLYYDRETGHAYRFYLDSDTSEYGWLQLADNDMTEILALANSAKDTADSKRRVFVAQPVPPYDNGDLWINNQEIYVCQISKESSETFDADDFIIATKYTDDTFATEVNDRLTVFSGQVTQILSDTYTKTEIQQIASGVGVDGLTVTAVVSTDATFDKDGMHYSKTDAPSTTTINYAGLEVDSTSDNSELLYAGIDEDSSSLTYGSSIVRTNNLTVKTYLQCANGKGRIEEYTDSNNHTGVGFFLT